MDKVREILLYFPAAMAVFALLGAVYRAMNNQTASMITLSTIFLLAALIVLPRLSLRPTLIVSNGGL